MGGKNCIEIALDLSVSSRKIEAIIPLKRRGIEVEFKGLPSSRDIYTGEYVVIPTFAEQNLDTSGKLMIDDVSVKAIPVSYTSNLSGGNTVYIGGS